MPVPEGASPSDELLTEALRATLIGLTRPRDSSSIWEPVHVARLTNPVRRRLSPMWPDDSATGPDSAAISTKADESQSLDSIQRLLQCLEEVGDFINLGHGYWLPAPLRLVELPTKHVLVFGALDTRALSRALHLPISRVGLARAVPEASRWATTLPEEEFAMWRGEVPELRSWTERLRYSASKSLQSSAQGFTDFDVYAAETQADAAQYFRWIRVDALRVVPVHPVLCRSSARPRSYWFGQIREVRAQRVLAGESPVPSENVRPLMYRLDLLAGRATCATVEESRAGSELTLRSWLPPAERRLLLALATPYGSERLPCGARLPTSFPQILAALEALDVRVLHN